MLCAGSIPEQRGFGVRTRRQALPRHPQAQRKPRGEAAVPPPALFVSGDREGRAAGSSSRGPPVPWGGGQREPEALGAGGGVSLPSRWSCAPRFAAAAGWLGASSGLLLLGPELRRRDPGFPVGKRLTPCTDVLTPLSPPARQHSQGAIPPGGGGPQGAANLTPGVCQSPVKLGLGRPLANNPAPSPAPGKVGAARGLSCPRPLPAGMPAVRGRQLYRK